MLCNKSVYANPKIGCRVITDIFTKMMIQNPRGLITRFGHQTVLPTPTPTPAYSAKRMLSLGVAAILATIYLIAKSVSRARCNYGGISQGLQRDHRRYDIIRG